MKYVFPCECEIDAETGHYALECRSPAAIAEGETLEKAKAEMLDLLLCILGDCIQFHEIFPEPMQSTPEEMESVSFTYLQTLKVMLINAMVERKWRPIDLANAMGITRQEASRILSPRSTTKYETIMRAIALLGFQLDIKAVPVLGGMKNNV